MIFFSSFGAELKMKFVYLLTLLTSLRDAFFVLGDRTGGASYGTVSSSEPSVESKIIRWNEVLSFLICSWAKRIWRQPVLRPSVDERLV